MGVEWFRESIETERERAGVSEGGGGGAYGIIEQ
jgi:hypothetical protein